MGGGISFGQTSNNGYGGHRLPVKCVNVTYEEKHAAVCSGVTEGCNQPGKPFFYEHALIIA